MIYLKKEYIHVKHKEDEDLEGLNIIVDKNNKKDMVRENLFCRDIFLQHGGLNHLFKVRPSLHNFTEKDYHELNTRNNCLLQVVHNTPCISKARIMFCDQYWDVEVLKGVFEIIDIIFMKGLYLLRNKISELNYSSGAKFEYELDTNSIKVVDYWGKEVAYNLKDLDTMYIFIQKYKSMFY